MSTYTCAVCNGRRSIVDAHGNPTFLTQPNGGRLCFVCIDKRDTALMAEGRISLALQQEGGVWYARNASGRLSFKLEGAPGAQGLQVLGAPRFIDRQGNEWRGRTYLSSGTAHFQMTKARAKQAAKDGEPSKPRRTGKRHPRKAPMSKSV